MLKLYTGDYAYPRGTIRNFGRSFARKTKRARKKISETAICKLADKKKTSNRNVRFNSGPNVLILRRRNGPSHSPRNVANVQILRQYENEINKFNRFAVGFRRASFTSSGDGNNFHRLNLEYFYSRLGSKHDFSTKRTTPVTTGPIDGQFNGA